MVAPTVDAYRAQLAALLPRGRAWAMDRGSDLQRLLLGLAGALQEFDIGATALIDEALPASTLALLPEWERTVGLPDACSDLSQTIGGRRAAVIGALVSGEGAAISDIEVFARRWGYPVRVREPAAEANATGTALDVTGGKWRFVWYVDIGLAARVRWMGPLSGVLDPVAALDAAFTREFECRLRELVPAHTHMVIGYFEAPEPLTWLGDPLTWLGDPLTWPG